MHLDVFRGDNFSLSQLSVVMNDLPHTPGQIGRLGLFSESGIATTSISIERVGTELQLVKAAPRGSSGQIAPRQRRNLRNISVVHLPQKDAIIADEVQGVRQFGSETELQTAQSLVTQRLVQMKLNNDVTMEWQKMGAIAGQILDSDGATVLIDLFDLFGMVQTTKDFELDNAATKVKVKCTELQRLVESKLGGLPYSGIRVECSEEFFDALVGHAAVEKAFDRFMDGAFMREQQRQEGGGGAFLYGGILWEEYRGKVGAQRFIPAGKARAIPMGTPGLFRTFYGPADYMETVNTIGLPYYAKAKPAQDDRSVEIEAQSNPLHLCTRPEAIVELSI